MRKPWCADEIALLRARFADCRTDELAAELGRKYGAVAQMAAKLGVKKSAAYLAGPDAHRLDGVKGGGTRFQAGQSAWNKGLRGVVGVQEACRATQFKKGRPAFEAHNYLPIGSLRTTKDGLLERKVSDDPSIVPARRWVAVHRLVWEQANGPVPNDCAIVFKAGCKTVELDRITLDAVECITRAELMRRNSYHTNYPPEVARVIQLAGALKRQINKRAKHEQNDHRSA